MASRSIKVRSKFTRGTLRRRNVESKATRRKPFRCRLHFLMSCHSSRAKLCPKVKIQASTSARKTCWLLSCFHRRASAETFKFAIQSRSEYRTQLCLQSKKPLSSCLSNCTSARSQRQLSPGEATISRKLNSQRKGRAHGR